MPLPNHHSMEKERTFTVEHDLQEVEGVPKNLKDLAFEVACYFLRRGDTKEADVMSAVTPEYLQEKGHFKVCSFFSQHVRHFMNEMAKIITDGSEFDCMPYICATEDDVKAAIAKKRDIYEIAVIRADPLLEEHYSLIHHSPMYYDGKPLLGTIQVDFDKLKMTFTRGKGVPEKIFDACEKVGMSVEFREVGMQGHQLSMCSWVEGQVLTENMYCLSCLRIFSMYVRARMYMLT